MGLQFVTSVGESGDIVSELFRYQLGTAFNITTFSSRREGFKVKMAAKQCWCSCCAIPIGARKIYNAKLEK